MGWCVRYDDAEQWVLTLLCQKLPADFKQMLVAFQQHVIGF
jgi:hypothetical protein